MMKFYRIDERGRSSVIWTITDVYHLWYSGEGHPGLEAVTS